MKKILISLSVLICLFAYAEVHEYNYVQSLTPAVTTLAANSTNSTLGTVYTFSNEESPVAMRLYCRASGIAASTNGTLKFVVVTSKGTNNFDTAAGSLFYVSIPAIGSTSTNQYSDWFYIAGVKSVAIGQIENTMAGVTSNFVIDASMRVMK